jgi:hypothetical protein
VIRRLSLANLIIGPVTGLGRQARSNYVATYFANEHYRGQVAWTLASQIAIVYRDLGISGRFPSTAQTGREGT